MIAFGPIPSRRLGRSLGINNIPPKVCTYSCAYCQLGRTLDMQVEPRMFYEPDSLISGVTTKCAQAHASGESIDYLTFVPDGEPTLDINLGREISALTSLGIRIAVITNSSLLWRKEVRERLAQADWVSVKIDSVDQRLWRRVNRPHKSLSLERVLDGIRAFAEGFRGDLATETMLLKGLNDSEEQAAAVADFLAALNPSTAYVSIPTRPPAESWAQAPGEAAINRFYQVVRNRVERVEHLIGYEGNAFAFTGNAAEDLLSITAVHPMREEAVREFLKRASEPWSTVASLLETGRLTAVEHQGSTYFLRTLLRHRGAQAVHITR